MVLQRMLDCGFNGYQLPAVPRACRSPRGRVPIKKKYEENPKLDILARFTGKLLKEDRAEAIPDHIRCANEHNIFRDTVELEQENEEKILETGQVEDMNERKMEAEPLLICGRDQGAQSASNFLDTMELDVQPLSVIKPQSNLTVSLTKDWLALGPSSGDHMALQVDDIDDDKYFVGSLSAAGDQKVVSSLNPGAHPKIDGKRKQSYQNWRACHTRQQPENIYPFKKRKFFCQTPLSKTRDFCSDGVINTSSTKTKMGKYDGAGASSLVAGSRAPCVSRDRKVKFSIESFKVPELLIDIPVTATVGSLKTTVMEAVTAILKDGLHVGVLLQGKKVRDDNKTLLQTGISRDDEHRGLGFMLEPGQAKIQPDTPQRLTGPVVTTAEALSVVPFRGKSMRNEIVQRRIRRPFTVSEVEALVQAVEKLGTGRWRDVKSHAFKNANHRTYVDLKDKWKTLVHTATISPRQRRGEPVPQELLDRVLAAHALWSEQLTEYQAKDAD